MTIRLITTDCRDALRQLSDNSVHCVVTSPPYWGLRDYGACSCGSGRFDLGQGDGTGGNINYRAAQKFDGDCIKCGGSGRIAGTEGQIGLEASYLDYVSTMVGVFREVRRVLRDDGTLWLNLGDSYANTGNKGQDFSASKVGYGGRGRDVIGGQPVKSIPVGLKQKDLCGIPWRVAFALQADGWYLRQDIIWSKPNPMPESVRDRCTKAHEYIFLLSKSGRYYYDQEAIAEPFADDRQGNPGVYNRTSQAAKGANRDRQDTGFLNNGGGWNADAARTARNKRSVWEIATQPFPEAHFATFPPALIEPCILAGCPKECCAKCGAPWMRQIQTEYRHHEKWFGNKQDARHSRGKAGTSYDEPIATKTIGFSPSCSCNAGIIPGTVLDPFGGVGTTGLVADRLGRDAILIELNPEYAAMAKRRIYDDAPLFADVDDYNAEDDFARSIDEAYAAIRARKAAGGKGWPE